jgi:hypothetical protein
VCSQTCGTGQKSRQRTVITTPQNNGRACYALEEVAQCNTEACSDCEVGLWSSWADCSTTCGDGVQVRKREITRQPSSGGTKCPDIQEPRACHTVPCNKDCIVHEWGSWFACTATCGTGSKSRYRTVKRPQTGDGAACPLLADTKDCNTRVCKATDAKKWEPVGPANLVSSTKVSTEADCVVGPWGFWSECTKTCGSGQQLRKRAVTKAASEKGKECPVLENFVSCNTQVCDTDCVVSDWEGWGSCYEDEKGDCQKEAKRTIVAKQMGTGNVCPVKTKFQNCDKWVSCSSWATWPHIILYTLIVLAVAGGAYWFFHQHNVTHAKPSKRRALAPVDPPAESEVLTQNGKGNDLPPFVETKPPLGLEYEPLMAKPLVIEEMVPPPPVSGYPPMYPMSTQRQMGMVQGLPSSPNALRPSYPMTSPMMTGPMSTGMSTQSAFRTMPLGGPSPFATRR